MFECYGYVFNELDFGKCELVIEEEKFFVAVCCGECELVIEVECVWFKYMMCIKRLKCFYIFFGGKL